MTTVIPMVLYSEKYIIKQTNTAEKMSLAWFVLCS